MQKDSIRIFWPIGMSFHVSSFLFQCFWKSSRFSSKQLQEPRQSMESFLQLGPVSSPNYHEFMKSYQFRVHIWNHVSSRCSIFRGWNPQVGSTSNGCTFSERWVLCPEVLEFWSNIHQGVAKMFWCFTCVFSLCFPTCRFFYRLKVVKSGLFLDSCTVLLCLTSLAKAERSGWKYIHGTSTFWRLWSFDVFVAVWSLRSLATCFLLFRQHSPKVLFHI